VLDLDETLCYTTPERRDGYDAEVTVIQKYNVAKTFYVFKRPYLQEFLSTLAQHYELVVFTASVKRYADAIIDCCDADHLVKRRYYRNTCECNQNVFVKDLSKICTSLKKCIILDNTEASYALHPSNGIAISSYLGDPRDTELKTLIPFLIAIANVSDVRSVLSRQNEDDALYHNVPQLSDYASSHSEHDDNEKENCQQHHAATKSDVNAVD